MVAKASIIKNYAKADAAGKVDIICKNYSNFIGIVDGYTEGLCYMIENEKAFNRKQSRGDLGVGCRHQECTVILQLIRQLIMLLRKRQLLPVTFPEMYWKELTGAKSSREMLTRFGA